MEQSKVHSETMSESSITSANKLQAESNLTSVNKITTESNVTSANKIKVLPAAVIKEIEQQNKARRLMGLSAIDIKIRNCLHCGGLFQSAGRRTCGCNTIHTSSLAGVEII